MCKMSVSCQFIVMGTKRSFFVYFLIKKRKQKGKQKKINKKTRKYIMTEVLNATRNIYLEVSLSIWVV